MEGKTAVNQHYIPRLLMRGFSSRVSGKGKRKKEYILVYERKREPFERKIEHIGSADRFYSEDSEVGSVDSVITEFENKLGIQINRLRKVSFGTLVDGAEASEIATHLMGRTRAIRDIFFEGIDQLFSVLQERFQTVEGIDSLVDLSDLSDDSFLADNIRKNLLKHPEFILLCNALNLKQAVFERMMLAMFREHLSSFSALARRHMQTSLVPLLAELPSTVAKSHGDAIVSSLATTKSRDVASWEWRVEGHDQADFILPDCVAVSITESGDFGPFTLTRSSSPKAIMLLPLSRSRLLIGRSSNAPEFNHSSFNAIAVQCSDRLFLSSTYTEEKGAWAQNIGVHGRELMQETIEGVTKPIGMLGVGEVAPQHQLSGNHVGGFSLTLKGFGDEEIANRLSDALRALFNVLGDEWNLERLEAITFAVDYAQAISEIDRGDLPPDSTVSEEVGIGIAKKIMILKEGRFTYHLVLRAELATSFLEGSDEQLSFAVSLIMSQLADIDSVARINKVIPNFLTRPLGSTHKGQLFRETYPAIIAYRSVQLSLLSGAKEITLEHASDRFESALLAYSNRMPEALDSYQSTGDLDALYAQALALIGELLESGARIHGFYDALNEPNNLTDTASETLTELNLIEWFESYGLDLRRLWEKRRAWKGPDSFTDLVIHVERLLWPHGVFPWETEDGSTYIRVIPSGLFNQWIASIPSALSAHLPETKKFHSLLND